MKIDAIKRCQLLIGTIFIIACIVYLAIVFFFDIDTEVIFGRFEDADNIFSGNGLGTEYPPFAIVFTIIPRIFASTAFWYNVGFVIEMMAFFIAGLLITCKLAERLEFDRKKAMIGYAILTMLMFEFVVDRFDIVPAVLTMASIYCYINKKYTWAFVLLSLGTMTKLYPAVLFPIYLIPFITDRNWKETIKGTAVFAVVSLAIVVSVTIALNENVISSFINYHADRPLQIESVASSIVSFFAMIGLTSTEIDFDFGSDNVIGAWPNAVAPLLIPLMIVSMVVIYILYAYILRKLKNEGKDSGEERLLLLGVASAMCIILFIITGKVFSAQYMIWIIPMFLFVAMVVKGKGQYVMFLLLTLILILTQIEFAYNVGYLGGGSNINNIGMIMILLRNIALIVFLYITARSVFDHITGKRRIFGTDV